MLGRTSAGDKRNLKLAKHIEDAFSAVVQLDLFPRTQIDVDVQILQNDGSVSAACVNAVSVALIDAGIPMRDFIVASTVGYLDRSPLVDLTRKEEMGGGPELLVMFEPRAGKIISLGITSKVSRATFETLVSLAEKLLAHL